jgi:hypothetical protein
LEIYFVEFKVKQFLKDCKRDEVHLADDFVMKT